MLERFFQLTANRTNNQNGSHWWFDHLLDHGLYHHCEPERIGRNGDGQKCTHHCDVLDS